MSDDKPVRITDLSLAELSHKTGLVIRSIDAGTINGLFDELERYDSQERDETFNYLRNTLNETRSLLGAEPVYGDE